MSLTLSELDSTPPGWAEELELALAGLAKAIEIVQKREARRLRPQVPDGRKPLYGTRHTVDAMGRPDLRQAAPQEYPELRE